MSVWRQEQSINRKGIVARWIFEEFDTLIRSIQLHPILTINSIRRIRLSAICPIDANCAALGHRKLYDILRHLRGSSASRSLSPVNLNY